MTFGYRPHFSNDQLGFSSAQSGNANFMQYHRTLNTPGFVNKNEKLVMNTLSNYLFERSDVFR